MMNRFRIGRLGDVCPMIEAQGCVLGSVCVKEKEGQQGACD